VTERLFVDPLPVIIIGSRLQDHGSFNRLTSRPLCATLVLVPAKYEKGLPARRSPIKPNSNRLITAHSAWVMRAIQDDWGQGSA